MHIKSLLQSKEKLRLTLAIALIAIFFSSTCFHFFKRFHPHYYAGEIYGKKIPLKKFKDVHNHLKIKARLDYAKMFEQIEPLLNLEERVWEQLILLYNADKKGLKATNKEVIKHISQYPFFQKAKKFDTALYNDILRRVLQIKPKDFEETIREFILVQELTDQVTSNVSLTDTQVLEEYENINEKVEISCIILPYEKYKDTTPPTEQEIQSYYDTHKQDLFVPPSIDIEYVKMDYPEEGGVQKQVETKYKAKAIYEEYQKNPNLKELAQKYKYDSNETGFFNKKNLNHDSSLPLKDLIKSFKLETDQIQEPVKGTKGYIVYKIKNKRKAYAPDFKESRVKIRDILSKEKTKEKSRKKAEEILNKILKTKEDFNQATENTDLTIENVALLPKKEVLYTLGIKNEDKHKLFKLNEKNKISEIISTQKGYAILYLTKFEPIENTTFQEEKDAFREDIINKRKDEIFSNFLKDATKKSKKKANPILDFLNTLPEK